MKKITKFSLATLLMASIGVSSAFASNTSWSTAGTIRTDVDKYINLNYFDEVIFDKVFATTDISSWGLQLGAATKVNDIYLGAHYYGNLWGDITGTNTKDKDEIRAKTNYHNFEVLIGLKNMGFKLTSSLQFDSDNKEIVNEGNNQNNEHTETTNYKITTTYPDNPFKNTYNFDLGWGGMRLKKNETLIKPYANIFANTKHNYDKKNIKTVQTTVKNSDNSKTQDFVVIEEIKESPNYSTDLGFKLGSEFVWKNESNFTQSLDISNSFAINLRDKDPEVKTTTEINKIKTPATTTTYTTTTNLIGKVNWGNHIYTTYRFEFKPVEKLTLSGTASWNTHLYYANPGYRESKNSKQYWNYDNQRWYYDNDIDNLTQKQLSTEMYPSFALGLSYAVKPNFKVNFGYSGTMPSIKMTDRTIEKTLKSTKKTSSTRTFMCSTGTYTSSLSAGLVWDLNKYCTLDAYLDLFNGDRSPSLNDIWKTNCSLGFTFKM